jgi:hypothetical protein
MLHFGLTYDYRCPYGRIVHDHVYWGLQGGADWAVHFVPFCLGQTHVEPGDPDIWDRPEDDSGMLALQLSIAIRDTQAEHFLEAHHALYEHRHAVSGSLRDMNVLGEVVASCGVDVDAAVREMESGRPLATIRDEHTTYARTHHVWGVPVFIQGDKAVFVRLLDRPDDDPARAKDTIERVIENISWDSLNEFKHTSVPR